MNDDIRDAATQSAQQGGDIRGRVHDLTLEALKASVAAAKQKPASETTPRKKATAKKTTAKKTTAKKTTARKKAVGE